MNILVLTYDVPATTNMPGSPRLFSLCKWLARRHCLTLVTPSQSQERYNAFLGDATAEGVFNEIVILPQPPAPSRWGQQVHRLRQEAHFETRYRNAKYHADQCRTLRSIASRNAIDVLYVDYVAVAQYVMDPDMGMPAIIDLHDCGTLFALRTMQREQRWLRRLALYAESRSIARVEKSLSRVFHRIIMNSKVDEEFFKTLDPSANTITIGNGVDSEFFMSTDAKGDPTKMVFTGVMNYGPNEDAVIYFCDAILPLIQKRCPQAQFWVVGKDPTDKVQLLAQRPGVHVTGGVPDVRPFLETAGIFVCPLRFGAGIKNKILAALAMGKAVVATRLSLEGLGLQEEEHVVAADDPAMFAGQVIRLIDDPTLAARLGRNGQAFVRAGYSWESSAAILEGILREAVDHQRRTS